MNLFGEKSLKKPSASDYMRKLKKRKKDSGKFQATRHQQDALETAKAFSDTASLPIYMRIFKRHRASRPELLKCREWVLARENVKDRGRMFVSVHMKFVENKGLQDRKLAV